MVLIECKTYPRYCNKRISFSLCLNFWKYKQTQYIDWKIKLTQDSGSITNNDLQDTTQKTQLRGGQFYEYFCED
jgi:hypothetical protein